MEIIKVDKLRKEFKSYERGEGFIEAVKSLFNRKVKISRAVKDIDFSIHKGEVVGFLVRTVRVNLLQSKFCPG